jgi:excisionase family DNA binding protein
MGETRWIDAEAASRRLGVSRETLKRWCRDGLVRRYRTVGLLRRYQIASDALEALVAEQVREVVQPVQSGQE